MEEIKILVFALVSFLSTEDIPIGAKSAEIEINTTTKQITLYQYDIYSLEQYREQAKSGLDSLLRTYTLNSDLWPLTMTSKHFFEEDGKLNAILYLQYKDLKDLRKISFYADEEENLSYPYVKEYQYDLQTGRIDGRYVRFDTEQEVKFQMKRKEYPFQGMYSLLEDWKVLEAEKFVDVSTTFSKKDFEKVRKFIFKNGDRQTYRNFDNDNPHYRFESFDVYLGAGEQPKFFVRDQARTKDYTELVIRSEGYHTLYLITDEKSSYLSKGGVYWHNRSYQDVDRLIPYLQEMKKQVKK